LIFRHDNRLLKPSEQKASHATANEQDRLHSFIEASSAGTLCWFKNNKVPVFTALLWAGAHRTALSADLLACLTGATVIPLHSDVKPRWRNPPGLAVFIAQSACQRV
jgi:hypothetical protein